MRCNIHLGNWHEDFRSPAPSLCPPRGLEAQLPGRSSPGMGVGAGRKVGKRGVSRGEGGAGGVRERKEKGRGKEEREEPEGPSEERE